MIPFVRPTRAAVVISTLCGELRNRPWSVLAVALALGTAATVGAAEPPTYFSIKMNDRLIGYAVVDRETVEQDGRQLLRLISKTSLKVALLGTERNTLLDSETLIEPATGRPISYRMTDTTNEVVRHVESDFDDGMANTWTYRDGDPRGAPVKTELPDGAVILGSNNFAHWQILLHRAMDRVAGEAATVSVFLPDAAQVDRFEFVRGGPQEVAAGGGMRTCASWTLQKANLIALTDVKTNDFVRLELPAQQTTIELADANVVKLAEKTRAEEVLTRHFAQSNIVFDDFLEVRLLKAEINVRVIGSGIAGDPSMLTTPLQRFDGRKDGDHIVGTIRIRSIRFDGNGGTPAFPSPSRGPEWEVWLKPSVHIESDHAGIVATAAELTKDAKNRWQAVQSIGQWVHREIAYTIADTPSARLAFETRKGDCGPHATLMVALLRAAGIPARLVGGLVYTPAFGGSFGQHAWVEVHMGAAGWLAVDPTTGEFARLSATHIKLFEGLGGVIPQSVNVLEFEPPNLAATGTAFGEPKPLPWTLGKKHTFNYRQGDQELGTETFTIDKIEHSGEAAYELKSDVKLQINPVASLRSSTTLVVAPNARPLSFTQDLSALLRKAKIVCTFHDGVVKEEISGTTNLSRDIDLPAGTYCFDNNLMGSWVLICSQLTLEPDKPVHIKTFHPSTMQIIPLTFTPKAPTAIKVSGKKVLCFECDVSPIKNTFWISRDGRFLRVRQGDLVIELAEID